MWPVRVSAGAFGPGRPHSDLLLSPDHAVYVGEVLIPIKHLINGSTIVQVPMARVTYHHLELPAHDVLLADRAAGGEFPGYAGRMEVREPAGADTAVSGLFRPHVGGVRLCETGRYRTGAERGARFAQ